MQWAHPITPRLQPKIDVIMKYIQLDKKDSIVPNLLFLAYPIKVHNLDH